MPLTNFSNSISGFKNLLINGNFAIAQRGTSFNFGSSALTLDRWGYSCSGGTGGTSVAGTISQQNFSPGQLLVPGEPANFIRLANTSIGSSLGADSYCILSQRINDVRSLAGQVCAISFWAQSNISGKKISLNVAQNFGTGGSSQVGTSGVSFNLNPSWTKYTVSFSYPSISGKTIGLSNYCIVSFYLQAGSNYDANTASSGGLSWSSIGNIDLANIQLEFGSQATGFEYRSYQQELDMSQFYYQRVAATDRFYAAYANQYGSAGIAFRNMRINPTPGLITAGTKNNVSVSAFTVQSSNSGRFEVVSASGGIDTYNIGEIYELNAEL